MNEHFRINNSDIEKKFIFSIIKNLKKLEKEKYSETFFDNPQFSLMKNNIFLKKVVKKNGESLIVKFPVVLEKKKIVFKKLFFSCVKDFLNYIQKHSKLNLKEKELSVEINILITKISFDKFSFYKSKFISPSGQKSKTPYYEICYSENNDNNTLQNKINKYLPNEKNLPIIQVKSKIFEYLSIYYNSNYKDILDALGLSNIIKDNKTNLNSQLLQIIFDYDPNYFDFRQNINLEDIYKELRNNNIKLSRKDLLKFQKKKE